MTQQVLYRSPNLKIFRNGPWASSVRDTLVICFQYRLDDQGLDQPGFAEEFFEKDEIDAAFVNCATNEWYQYRELPDALSTLRDFAAPWNRTITYGSSMGGYAALRFARAVGANSSIAVGPQYSPRSAVVAGEGRYEADITTTEFLYEDSYQACPTVENYVIYDPMLKLDKRHVMEYLKTARLVQIPIHGGGHTPTALLAQFGMLSEFVHQLILGEFSSSRFRRSLRQARRSSPQLWREFVDALETQ